MYICALCGRRVGPNIPLNKRAVETRVVRYPKREEAHCFSKNGKLTIKDDPGGAGQENVKEQNLCSECLAMTA
jgi:hypothetical protein